jgi:hypothetical protein
VHPARAPRRPARLRRHRPHFSQGPIDLERLAGELAQADDRLHLDGDEALDLAAATVRTVRLALDHAASP